MNGEKFFKYYKFMNRWIYIKNHGKTLADHEKIEMSSGNIAIYGFGDIGKRFLEELQSADLKVKYVVDQKADIFFTDFPMFKPTDSLPDVDIMVVTPFYEYEKIKELLSKSKIKKIVSIEVLVNELWQEVCSLV